MTIQHLTVGPLAVNCYRIDSKGEAVLVDPGDEPDRLLDWVARDGLRLKEIWLTHAHFDHVGAVQAIHARTGVPLVMHAGDREMLRHTRDVALMFGLEVPQPPEPGRFVNDGDTLVVGDVSAKVLHTPGHSPGGVTFVVGEQAIVGDLLFAGSVGRTDLPGGDWETLLHSIQTRVLPLGDAVTVLPGHGPKSTVGHERQSNPFLVGNGPRGGGRL